MSWQPGDGSVNAIAPEARGTRDEQHYLGSSLVVDLLQALRFPRGGIVMLRQTKVVVSFVLAAFLLMMEGTLDANAGSKLPDPIKAGVAEKLFRLDCGHSLANDESVW